MDAALNALVANADRIGALGLAIFVIAAIIRGWLVTGRALARAEKQVDEDREDRRAETEVLRRLVRFLERQFPASVAAGADLYDDLSGRGSA